MPATRWISCRICGARPVNANGVCFVHEHWSDGEVEESERLAQELRDQAERAMRGKGSAPARVGAPAQPKRRSLAESVAATLDLIDRRRDQREVPVQTGWKLLDETLRGGLWPGLHMIIAGTGAGKTQLSLQIAAQALGRGIPTCLVELELDEEQVLLRLAQQASGVHWSDGYLGQVSHDQRARLASALGTIAKQPLFLECSDALSTWSADALVSRAAALRAQHPEGPALLVLDFLQLIGPDPADPRLDLRERIGRASYVARQVAKRHRMAVVAINSVSRQNYATTSLPWRKSGLRVDGKGHRYVAAPDLWVGLGKESGEIEYSADSVIVLAHPDWSGVEGDSVFSELQASGGDRQAWVAIVAKQRCGPTGWVALERTRGSFRELPASTAASLVSGAASGQEPETEPLLDRVVAYVARCEREGRPPPSANDVAQAMGGRRSKCLEAVAEAKREWLLESAGSTRGAGLRVVRKPKKEQNNDELQS